MGNVHHCELTPSSQLETDDRQRETPRSARAHLLSFVLGDGLTQNPWTAPMMGFLKFEMCDQLVKKSVL